MKAIPFALPGYAWTNIAPFETRPGLKPRGAPQDDGVLTAILQIFVILRRLRSSRLEGRRPGHAASKLAGRSSISGSSPRFHFTEQSARGPIVGDVEALGEAGADRRQLRTRRCRASHVPPQASGACRDPQRPGKGTLPFRPFLGGRQGGVSRAEFALAMQQVALDPEHFRHAPPLVIAVGAGHRLLDDLKPPLGATREPEGARVLAEKVQVVDVSRAICIA
jgi:hypothetical protein